ncbi:hypothetical protein [Candidatus Hodgkinia cicadicola]|uniref:hypothetical protein n=1 Tax=Candidatus Hodgkinia cicadicola TaxID=573658 RepID=UPI001788B343
MEVDVDYGWYLLVGCWNVLSRIGGWCRLWLIFIGWMFGVFEVGGELRMLFDKCGWWVVGLGCGVVRFGMAKLMEVGWVGCLACIGLAFEVRYNVWRLFV